MKNTKVERLSFDAEFGDGGVVSLNNSGTVQGQVLSIKALADGGLIAIAELSPPGAEERPILARFSKTGALVEDFGDSGYAYPDFRFSQSPWNFLTATFTTDEKNIYILAIGRGGLESRLVCVNEEGHQVMAWSS